MGIPGYYRLITNKYRECIKNDKNNIKKCNLHFDYNGLIHIVYAQVITNLKNENILDNYILENNKLDINIIIENIIFWQRETFIITFITLNCLFQLLHLDLGSNNFCAYP